MSALRRPQLRSSRGRSNRIAGKACAGALALATAALGFLAGRASVPPETRPPDTSAEAEVGRASPPAGNRVAVPRESPVDVAGIDFLATAGDTLIDALRWSDDPLGLIEYLVDGMTREELSLAIAALTGSTREDLEEKRDLHRFANSLARVALSGVVTDPISAPSLEIEFATRLGDASQRDSRQDVFASSSSRIFGVFPLEAGAHEQVIAKWYRVDEPEILMFEELPVLERDGQGFIRFDRSEGWPQGSYRLEIYSPDEDPELLASGDYETQGTERPLAVSFR